MELSRRRLFALGVATGTAAVEASLGRRSDALVQRPASTALDRDPFTLGVASGDPWADSVVLWTRLVPHPEEIDGAGLGQRPYEVEWQLAGDATMSRPEREGTTWAVAELGHSVHVIVDGLAPGREYWYRFRTGRWTSPIGRTKTAPPAGQTMRSLDLAVASCQRWDDGYYAAHRHLAADRPDAVVFLGDYIYEDAVTGAGRRGAAPIPPHLLDESRSLARYRAQYAWYKLDPDLQAAHHAAPWVATWDDHEVENDYAAAVAGRSTTRHVFEARRAAAYQAYWEHLPLRSPPPAGAAMRIHRRLRFGSLADLHVLDTRQFRSDQVTGQAWQRPSPARSDPARTMLGPDQERWLGRGLRRSAATWNVVAQQVIAGRLRVAGDDGDVFNRDTWDGYPAAQRDFHDALATSANPVVLTGDLHAGYALDITSRLDDPTAPVIAVELAATSVSSGGDGSDLTSTGRHFLDANPHLHFASQRRGYLRCRLAPDRMTVVFRTVAHVSADPDAPVSTARTFEVEAGVPGLHAA